MDQSKSNLNSNIWIRFEIQIHIFYKTIQIFALDLKSKSIFFIKPIWIFINLDPIQSKSKFIFL